MIETYKKHTYWFFYQAALRVTYLRGYRADKIAPKVSFRGFLFVSPRT